MVNEMRRDEDKIVFKNFRLLQLITTRYKFELGLWEIEFEKTVTKT